MELPYQPYYCEENAYRICELLLSSGKAERMAMLFIFSEGPWVDLHNQRASPRGKPIYWDYHVVGISTDSWQIWDPASHLPPGLALRDYLTNTFPGPPRARPLFRLVEWTAAREAFGSDRSHMKDADGHWLQPPPSWPPINPEKHTLPQFLAPEENGFGRLFTLPQLIDRSP